MSEKSVKTFLCIASFFKGAAFLCELKRLGCNVILLTSAQHLDKEWPREAIDEIHALPDLYHREHVIHGVSYLARTRIFDRIIALDDFDVEMAATLREHLRIAGMGETTARYFRDKLAMRRQARERGIRAPRFEHILNRDQIRTFIGAVPGPWVLKPRSQASAIGIKKVHDSEGLWQAIDALGDRQSFHLLEEFIPGDVYHVDAIVTDRTVRFAAVSRYDSPPMHVSQEGGIFCTRTIAPKSRDARALEDLNREIVEHFGLVRGVTHTEFIKSKSSGEFYFLETAARVGGAHIAELVEAATGINLWVEWARLEAADSSGGYELPPRRNDYAGLVLTLARQEEPDDRRYDDPEICWRLRKKNHVGLVVKSRTARRVQELTQDYMERFQQDFHAALPAPEQATS